MRLPLIGISTGMMGGGLPDLTNPAIATMTVTTTGAQTLTLQGVTVAAGKTVTVYWGDGSSNAYTAGAGTRTHDYAGAGTWTVKLSHPSDVTLLDLRDAKITALGPLAKFTTLITLSFDGTKNLVYDANTNPLPGTLVLLTIKNAPGVVYNANTNPLPSGLEALFINTHNFTYDANADPLPAGLKSLSVYNDSKFTYNANTDPLPVGLTTLAFYNLPNVTYDANADPLPGGIASLTLNSLPNVTWDINALQPWPTAVTECSVISCPKVTVSAWTDNAIRSIQLENIYNAAAVDAVLNAILANKANFTYATPTLDLLGGSNAAPSGTYQAADPVTSGKEAAYALVNGNGSYAPGPEWTVTTA